MSSQNDAYDSKLHFLTVTELKEVEAKIEAAFNDFEKYAASLFARREELLDRVEALEKLKEKHETEN